MFGEGGCEAFPERGVSRCQRYAVAICLDGRRRIAAGQRPVAGHAEETRSAAELRHFEQKRVVDGGGEPVAGVSLKPRLRRFDIA